MRFSKTNIYAYIEGLAGILLLSIISQTQKENFISKVYASSLTINELSKKFFFASRENFISKVYASSLTINELLNKVFLS